ncbi:FmdB family zinc ribbon protein [Geotalea uraniireducens]|uniref:FmdB family zinc ribbon protein n=1 Tax=Geotalea uraniireducens TaxID=351604 RepID=UPI0003017873|nr:zinc ribbon domain-containing protein [Geotalea uraniireducens]
MPIYEYICAGCGEEFTKLQKMGGAAAACPKCGSSDVARKISACAIGGATGGGKRGRQGRRLMPGALTGRSA